MIQIGGCEGRKSVRRGDGSRKHASCSSVMLNKGGEYERDDWLELGSKCNTGE